MAADGPTDYDQTEDDGSVPIKIICLGDSAVGKSKLVERFLLDGYQPQQLSTYALTLFTHKTTIEGRKVRVDFWDTAGQERFMKMHPSYYHQAHACVMVFDITRKITYKNLTKWYQGLREYRPDIPCLCAANKIDADETSTKKSFNFAGKHNMPFHFVSASNGTNVVKLFKQAIKLALHYKENSDDITDLIMEELRLMELDELDGSDKDSTADSPGESSKPSTAGGER